MTPLDRVAGPVPPDHPRADAADVIPASAGENHRIRHPSARRTPCPHADQLPPGFTVCKACHRERDAERKRQQRQPRRCACGAVLDKFKRTCPDCQAQREREYRREWLERPGNRERANASRRRWYRRHPEVQRRWVLERRKDPEKLAQMRETARMSARLYRERNGHPSAPVPEQAYPPASTQWTTDAEPVRRLVQGVLDSGWTSRELALASGVSEKLIYRLVHEGANGVTVAAADRIVVTLGLHLDLLEATA